VARTIETSNIVLNLTCDLIFTSLHHSHHFIVQRFWISSYCLLSYYRYVCTSI